MAWWSLLTQGSGKRKSIAYSLMLVLQLLELLLPLAVLLLLSPRLQRGIGRGVLLPRRLRIGASNARGCRRPERHA